MVLYDYTVIYNPIFEWQSGRDYFVGNKVEEGGSFFECNTDHTSSGANQPPNNPPWFVITPTSPNTNITQFVETLKENEIGSGEIRSLSLRINAEFGEFITNTGSGDTPIIDQFDRIFISTTDQEGRTYDAIYEVDIIHPTFDGKQGTVLPVDLLGSERYLQQTLFADQFFFKSMFTTSKEIVDFYNNNKGTEEVRIVKHDANSSSGGFNDLPAWTANDYTFNLTEKKHYDGLLEVIDRGGSSIAAGGAADFFELGFISDPTNADQINFRAFSSGNPSDQTSIPNIINTISINPAEQEGEIVSTQGSVVGTWTSEAVGTLPRQNADFIGGLEAWRFSAQHIPGETYPQDAIVLLVNTTDSQGDNEHYKANTETSQTPPDTDWDQYFFTDFLANEVGGIVQYSFWTNELNDEWKSNGAKTDGDQNDDPPTFDSLAVWDSNQVIVDGTFTRTWADTKALNFAGIPAKFKRNGGVYRGFRVLVNGVGTDEFVGFDNDVIQWDGTQWLIFKEPTTEALVGVDDEGRVYQFDTDVAAEWADISSSLNQSNDCYHAVWAVFNTQGHNNKDNGISGNFGELSAVTYEFRYETSDNIQSVFNQPQYYRMFAGIDFRVPYPFNSDNGNILGSIYGNSDQLLPATFEAENMGLTSSGKAGFNNNESEDLGPLDALTFFIKHEWRHQKDGSGALVQSGNLSYRCALYDIDDNVVTNDFVIPFNNLWEQVSLPITGFKAYEARAPWAFGNAGQNTFLQGIEVLNKFRWRNIKKISIHWLGPYDDEGRYFPTFQQDFVFPSLFDTLFGFITDGFNVKLSIDSFQWAKPGLSLSPPNTSRPLQPEFFYEPLITNKFQNDQANLAKLEITQFRHKGFDVTTIGRNDLRFGDSFFLENSELVNDADRTTADLDPWVTATDYTAIENDVQDAGIGYRCILDHTSSVLNQPPNATFWSVLQNPIPNTIKLVVKKITRTIDKVPDVPGGYLTTFTGVRRFEEGEQ